MTCSQYRDADLAAFVADPRDAEWAPFLAHYPTCAECSAALARWGEFEAVLRDALADAHPQDAELLRFADAPDSLTDADRSRVAAHLDHCAPCRDALNAALAFAPPQRVAPVLPSPALARSRSRWRAVAGSRHVPALAAALAAVLALAWLLPRLAEQPGASAPSPPAPIAEAPSPPPLAQPLPSPPEAHPEPAPIPIAEKRLPPVPQPDTEPEPAPAPIARAEPDPVAVPAPAPPAPPTTETWQLSAIGNVPLDYVEPRGMPSGRVSAGARAGGSAARVTALAPRAVGLSLDSSPTLYWLVSEPTQANVVLTVNDIDAMRTVFQKTLPGPHPAGTLSATATGLEPGRNYQWLATVEDEPDSAGGAVMQLRPAPAQLRTALEAATPEERLRLLASNGYWYDALDALTRSIARAPDEASLRRARADLLAGEGLAAPAAAEAAAGAGAR